MAVDVTLNIPEAMMQLAQKVAADAKVPVEVVLLDWLHHPVAKPSLTNVDAQLEGLAALTDIQLWTVVHRHLEAEQQRLDALVEKHESGNILSADETQAWVELTEWIQTLLLLRSQALILLGERGFDVRRFFTPQNKYD
jgi:hypothetical protein